MNLNIRLIALLNQVEMSMNAPRESPVIGLNSKLTPETSGEHRVGVLSGAILRAAVNAYGHGHRGLAARVGVTEEVVADTASGACPAWELPYNDFTALAGTVEALWAGAAFETAAECDLLLSLVLDGEQYMATDVLTEPGSRDLARALLRLAVREAERPLLPEGLRVLLCERAAALTGSGSPDAWVGREILTFVSDEAARTGELRCGGRMNANGTAWRMRSLIAMGHDATRIARALGVSPGLVQRLIRGERQTVTVSFHVQASRLWDAWWDKTPPERTAVERRAASRARHQAEHHNWPAAAGLDEELLDTPGYRPRCHYRPATGTGIAADFSPRQSWRPTTRKIA